MEKVQNRENWKEVFKKKEEGKKRNEKNPRTKTKSACVYIRGMKPESAHHLWLREIFRLFPLDLNLFFFLHHQRWFVLHDSKLTYYNRVPRHGGDELGTIVLTPQCTINSGVDDGAFSIITEDRTFKMVAPSNQERDAWMQSLKLAREAVAKL